MRVLKDMFESVLELGPMSQVGAERILVVGGVIRPWVGCYDECMMPIMTYDPPPLMRIPLDLKQLYPPACLRHTYRLPPRSLTLYQSITDDEHAPRV